MSSMKRAKICTQSVKTFGIPQLFPEIDPREKNAGNSVLAYSACLLRKVKKGWNPRQRAVRGLT